MADDESYRALAGSIVAPILGATFGPGDELKSGSFSIVELHGDLAHHFGDWDSMGQSDLDVMASATHAVVIAPANIYYSPAEESAWPATEAWDQLADFFSALSLATPNPATFVELSLRLDAGGDTGDGLTSTIVMRDYAERIDAVSRPRGYESTELDSDTALRALHQAGRFATADPSLRVAARRLVGARQRSDSHDVILDLCIGIEALLGTGNDEIVHRVALRCAAMLAGHGWGPSSEVYKAMRDVYSYRSQVVHGSPAPYKKELLHIDGKPIHAVRFALAALISLLHTFLERDTLTPKNVDDHYIFPALDAQRSV